MNTTLNFYIEVIADAYKNNNSTQKVSKSELLKEINSLNGRIAKASEPILDRDIDNYKTIKPENEYKINVLEAKLAEIAQNNLRTDNIEPLLRKVVIKLTQQDATHSKSTTFKNWESIDLIYPEKFTFEELQHRIS